MHCWVTDVMTFVYMYVHEYVFGYVHQLLWQWILHTLCIVRENVATDKIVKCL